MEVDENGNSPYRDYKVLTASADTVQRKSLKMSFYWASIVQKRGTSGKME
jgi:hypothetical protein